MFSLVLHHDRRKSYPSSIHKWPCKQASSHLSLWTGKSIAFAKDFLPEKTCKLLRRLLYRNGFVLCSVLASPIFVWRNGVWQRRRLFHRPYPRFPNLYRCNIIKTVSFQSGIRLRSFQTWYMFFLYSYGETEHGKEENFSESDICGMLEQPVGWILSPELLQASKMTVFHRTVGREVYLPFQLLWKKGRQFVLCHAKPD